MQAENDEPYTISLTDALPVCHSSGIASVKGRCYKDVGTERNSYDSSLRYQNTEDQT